MTEPQVSGHHLRRRLAIALSALAAGAALLVSSGFWASEHFIEEATLEQRLAVELSSLINSGVTPLQIAQQDVTLRYYRPKLGGVALPDALAALAPGEHDAGTAGGGEQVVLVRQIAPGDIAALVYRDTERPTRRRWLATSLAISLVLTALAALWLARLLARQTLAPLDGLVSTLRGLDPELRGQRLPEPNTESELAVIAQAFNAYMQKLDQLVERERAFAAAASHELRTPLAVIQGAAEVLNAQGVNTPPVQRILRAADAAKRDLEALLWLSRSATGTGVNVLAPEHIALHERLQALCAAQIDIGAVHWQLEPCYIQAPAGAVAVIVSNLLRNALRAAPQAGGVRVRLNEQVLEVEDDGPGIAAELLAQVFLPGISGADGGSGMGLYIASTLAMRLGWQLSLANRRSGGGVLAQLRFSKPLR